MINELYKEANEFTFHTAKVASTILMSAEEYTEFLKEVRPDNTGMIFPFDFHDKPIYIHLKGLPHMLFTVQEWINLGCPKELNDEGGLTGWTSKSC
jgi:hypothetical protein